MYGPKCSGGVITGGVCGGSLAATGAPVAIMIVIAAILVVTGLLLLRWGRVRRGNV